MGRHTSSFHTNWRGMDIPSARFVHGGTSLLRLAAASVLLLLAYAPLPPAVGHVPSGPNPACEPAANPHDYAVGVVPSVVILFDGCSGRFNCTANPLHPACRVCWVVSDLVGPPDCCDSLAYCPPTLADGDFEFGIGGGFLPASHHNSMVCVEDAVLGSTVQYRTGADLNGDGVVDDHEASSPLTGCAAMGSPGADGGWWVFVEGAATTGHIWTL